MKVGMYRDGMNIQEEKAWGKILADVARHLADAMGSGYGEDSAESLKKISASFLDEIEGPTAPVKGGFSRKN